MGSARGREATAAAILVDAGDADVEGVVVAANVGVVTVGSDARLPFDDDRVVAASSLGDTRMKCVDAIVGPRARTRRGRRRSRMDAGDETST